MGRTIEPESILAQELILQSRLAMHYPRWIIIIMTTQLKVQSQGFFIIYTLSLHHPGLREMTWAYACSAHVNQAGIRNNFNNFFESAFMLFISSLVTEFECTFH